MGTIDKVLSLLGLFTPDEPQWTVEAAASRIGVPTSTTYRYFRSLADAGLIVDFAAGRYVIGPAIVELDRMARNADPLINAADAAMDRLSRRGPERNVVILGRIFRRRVMCVDQRRRGNHPMTLSYERGRPMPLYRGSVSKIILAYLPSRTLARHFKDDHQEIAEAGLGNDLKTFRQNLRAIRRTGACISMGEVDRGVIGISAPVTAPDGDVFASLSLVIPDEPENSRHLASWAEHVIEGAEKTSNALRAASEAQMARSEDAGIL